MTARACLARALYQLWHGVSFSFACSFFAVCAPIELVYLLSFVHENKLQ